MTPPYRLAAIDLDDTLLGPDHLVSPRNARAVRALAQRGVVCVLASGRMHQATARFADELGLHAPVISYNGSMVRLAPRTAETWLHERVPADAAAKVVEFCAEHGHHLNYYLDDHLYVARRGPWAEFYVRQTGSPMEVSGDLRRFLGTKPTKMILIDSPEITDHLLARFQARFGASLNIMKTNPQYLEFMNPAADKGSALKLVACRLSIPRDKVVAFGDGLNDLPMIRWAGLGVAMGGAKTEVLAAAKVVAPPFAEDGLASKVEEIFGLVPM